METQWQHRYLTARECDLCQGYLFSRPLPLAELPLEKLSRNWEAHRGERVHAGLRVI